MDIVFSNRRDQASWILEWNQEGKGTRQLLKRPFIIDHEPKVKNQLAFNSPNSPFAEYDKKIVGKVGLRWKELVDQLNAKETGETEIAFRLFSDGKVDSVAIKRSTISTALANYAIQAIKESAPFEPLPKSMQPFLTNDFREGTIVIEY